MIDYFVVNELGCVVCTGQVPEAFIELQYCDGFQIGRAEIGDFIDGDGNVQPLPISPSSTHVFDYQTKTYVLDVAKVRAKRDSLLSQSDWTQLPDVPMETKAAWKSYRQALRDITEQIDLHASVEWPNAPGKDGFK